MLNPTKLLNNLKEFKYASKYPIDSIWPRGRRSSVLILLFIGNRGELRVLLTKRSRSLKSFSGHVSLPGGKADSDHETFENVARREAEEEIGLPRDEKVLQNEYDMAIENISTVFPCYVSQTVLSVKPLVCFLHNYSTDQSKIRDKYTTPLNADKFFGKLNPGETSSLFSIPINDLVAHLSGDTTYKPEYTARKENKWKYGGITWDVKHFYYPVDNNNEMSWLRDIEDLSSYDSSSSMEEEFTKTKDVWGMTAKILSDISLVANGLQDIHELHFNHEDLINGLYVYGKQMQPGKRSDWEKSLINRTKGVKYTDVIPEANMKEITRGSSTF
ncbi:hypothetical protein KAFR_0H02060 [Kazachstania africana CBS 2517]|uniref:Nudix hydrolase domain-containing protein n=1 Tax=Kazachstania africana (strain ATCC 22294 / BCRC 22015 / CBS 2517 / CECT 1963 / NBRC 1671 / NRRL Y-8276) TaxID=1071382 RepID=H2AZ59_KAZAF|nr:hypothetical protein KAFR_0H02060 [Kazachstania africana CBS 2517]CCF59615.1 hypothetical protein KAFR_0H02060 [Kazachstania africana CBS 2517]